MTAPDLLTQRGSYVAGRWIDGGEGLAVENPADESLVCELSTTPLKEIRRAVAEARRSFDDGGWASLAARERAKVLQVFIDYLESVREPFIATMVAEAGQPRMFAEMAQFSAGVTLARNTIDLFLSLAEEEANPVPVDELVRGRVAISIRRFEPVGVVSAITPYNGAVIMAFQKLIPALMAGNSVILRPSPLTPLSSLAFGAAAEAAGLPDGVLSVVVESGSAGAEILTSDPGGGHGVLHRFHRCGSTDPGSGGAHGETSCPGAGRKSAQIYLPDAIGRAGAGAAAVVAMTAGQACVAATRMFVPQGKRTKCWTQWPGPTRE